MHHLLSFRWIRHTLSVLQLSEWCAAHVDVFVKELDVLFAEIP
jgi:hypothetical protein